MKKLICLLGLTLVLTAQDLTVNVSKVVDQLYVPAFKAWLACHHIGPNVGTPQCSGSDVTDRQASDWLVARAEEVINVYVQDRAIPWAEKNNVATLPQDHQDDVTAATDAVDGRNVKRERAVR